MSTPAGQGEQNEKIKLDKMCIRDSGRNEHLLINLAHTFADFENVVCLLFRQIGDANATGEIDKADMHAQLLMQLDRQLEELARQNGIVVVGNGIAGQKCMQAKMLDAKGAQAPEAIEKLLLGKSIFGVLGVVHNIVADGEIAARIKPAADGFGNGGKHLRDEMCIRDRCRRLSGQGK